jgi:cytochrome c oxidase subunit 2
MKPGARMPSSGERIPHADLQSIAAWLTQLK